MYGPGNLYCLCSYVFVLQHYVQNLIGNESVWFGLCSTERKIIIYQNLGLLAVVIKNRLDTDPLVLALQNFSSKLIFWLSQKKGGRW